MLNLLLFVLGVSPLIVGFPHNLSKDVDQDALLFLGSVDGHLFFSEPKFARNWFEAKQFCEGQGMHIARVTTPQEAQFLQLLDNPNFLGNFWVAGRDAQTLRQFVWDTVETEISYIPLGHVDDEIQTCVYFSKTTGHNHFHSSKCTSQWFTLCEAIGSV